MLNESNRLFNIKGTITVSRNNDDNNNDSNNIPTLGITLDVHGLKNNNNNNNNNQSQFNGASLDGPVDWNTIHWNASNQNNTEQQQKRNILVSPLSLPNLLQKQQDDDSSELGSASESESESELESLDPSTAASYT